LDLMSYRPISRLSAGRAMHNARYVIEGRPASKKNSHRVRHGRGRSFVGNSGAYLRWADGAVTQLQFQRGSVATIPSSQMLHASVAVYLAKGQRMDIDNALGGPFDVLQAAKVIANDAQIKSLTVSMHRDPVAPRVAIDLVPLTDYGARV